MVSKAKLPRDWRIETLLDLLFHCYSLLTIRARFCGLITKVSAEVDQELAMRVSLLILGVLASVVWIETAAAARNGGWCAYYNMGGGATNCGFATFQQCMAAVSGIGGSCSPSPY